MPLIRDEKIGMNTRLCVWHITEAIEDLPGCERDLSHIHSVSRRKEILVVQALLEIVTSRHDLVIEHDDTGRPLLPGWNVSISHTHGWAALIISANQNVAVDIEYQSDRVSRIVDRFIRQDENRDSQPYQLINWSAKETVYKFFGEENLRYFEMRLKSFCPYNTGRVEVENLKSQKSVWVDYEQNADYVLTYIVGK